MSHQEVNLEDSSSGMGSDFGTEEFILLGLLPQLACLARPLEAGSRADLGGVRWVRTNPPFC